MKYAPSVELKTTSWHVLAGVYVALANIMLLAVITSAIAHDLFGVLIVQDEVIFSLLQGAGMLFALPGIILLVMSTMVTPYEYSVLGKLKRTPCPNVPPLVKYNALSERGTRWVTPFTITNQYASAGFWSFYEDGLAIYWNFIGSVFIPYEYIQKVGTGFGGGYLFWHSWPEVFSPIGIPEKVYQDLDSRINKSRL